MRKFGFSLGSFFKIGIIAALFILLFKWVANKAPIPGLASAANAI